MPKNTIFVLLADDDIDDQNFFNEALEQVKMQKKVEVVNDGDELMNYLTTPNNPLPDILFLDLNMPKKTGLECLQEIRKDANLKDLIIAIYSTSSSDKHIEETFVNGANIYIKKPGDFNALKKIVNTVMTLNWQYHTTGLNRDNFLLSLK